MPVIEVNISAVELQRIWEEDRLVPSLNFDGYVAELRIDSDHIIPQANITIMALKSPFPERDGVIRLGNFDFWQDGENIRSLLALDGADLVRLYDEAFAAVRGQVHFRLFLHVLDYPEPGLTTFVVRVRTSTGTRY